MTLTEKRKEKRLAKLYSWLAVASLLIWALEWVVLIVIRNHTEGEWGIHPILLISMFLAPVFASLYFLTVSAIHKDKLLRYLRRIKEYRVRRAFQKCVAYIEANDLNMAITIYNDYIPEKHNARDYLYSVLIMLMSRSTDPELQKKGLDKIADLKEHFNPANINFNLK